MKRIFILFLLFFLFAQKTLADSVSPNPSLSDAVYADLALKGYLDNVSVSFYDGNPDNAINVNETRHWIPASTVKLFAAMYAFKQIAEHRLSLYDSFTAEGKNVVPTESVPDALPTIQEGDNLTVDRLLRQMITQSDNTAFNILLDILDRKAITDYIHSIGLTHSAVGSKLNLDTSQEQYEFEVLGYGINTTTAEDYTKAFTLIWQNNIPGAKELLEILKQQKINYMLPLLLPKDVVVGHKHGDLDPLYHDGGIVFGPKTTYAVSIFTNVGDPNVVAHLSELIYKRDFNLVGGLVENKISAKENYPLDALVTQKASPPSEVLGVNNQLIQDQPITAADLGITAKDLSLIQPTTQLPKVIIPADSPWHFLVSVWRKIKKTAALSQKARLQADLDAMFLQISEAKDLLSRGKLASANVLLQNAQEAMLSLSQAAIIKKDARAQTALQALSETRFQLLGDTLKTLKGAARNELIKEIGQQAKSTLTQVQPNLPLATNATNPIQKPLVGEIVDKTDTSVIVKTAGGQQITIPLINKALTVKIKDISQTILPPSVSGNVPSGIETTAFRKSDLSALSVGTTIALIGSSVGNTFSPTFILTNLPTELVAPEPVTVLKVDAKNQTMVISENGIPVQVNVSRQTTIRGSDTNVSFDAIKAGDVVLVHGKPLLPVAPVPTPKSSSLPPAASSSQSSNKTLETPKPTAPGLPLQQQNSSASSHQATPVIKYQNQKNPDTLKTTPSSQNSAQPSSTTSTTPTSTLPQPKVIQSTSIQIIEKREDVKRNSDQATSQPKKPQQPSSGQTKSQPQTVQPKQPVLDEKTEKKK